MSDFTRIERGNVYHDAPDLMASFHRRFRDLSEAIAGGLTLSGKTRRDREHRAGSSTLVLRSRNYPKKAVVHNTKEALAATVVEVALRRGYDVINIGSPALPLGIKDPGYSEISNELDLDTELGVLSGLPIACQTDAGLFALIACLDSPICALSEEWSVTSFPDDPISLLAARQLRQPGTPDLGFPSCRDRAALAAWLDAAPGPSRGDRDEKSTHNKRSSE